MTERTKERLIIAGIIGLAIMVVWMIAGLVSLFRDPLADRKPKSQMIFRSHVPK
ncbi:MAG: hypothetical protein K0S38_275 [Candidatus Paceibacter sp.]|nr:hypothetical protein [Candidatus Paceibacter sp.]